MDKEATTTASNKILWNQRAVKRLIALYQKHYDEIKSSTIRSDVVCDTTAAELKDEEFSFTSMQCKDKFKYLKLNVMIH